jgi:hypothetical protein
MSDAPQLPGPSQEPPFRSQETRPPNLGLGVEDALRKLQQRRAAQAAQPQAQHEPPGAHGGPPPRSMEAALQPTPLAPRVSGPADPPQLPPPDAVMPYTEQPHLPGVAPQADVTGLVVQVEIDGQLVPVTVDELRRGYLREQDYRRKSQQAAVELRRGQEAQQQYAMARQALEQRLPAYTAQHAAEFSQPVDWDKLSREDPIGSVQKMGRLLMAQQAAAEQLQLQQQRAGEELQRKQHLMQIGHEVLCRVIPGWADPATRTLIQQAIAQHAVSLGYPAEQVQTAEVLDPREILMAWKSMNYDRLMGARVQPQPAGTRTVNGNGANRRQPQAAGLTELEERFSQTRTLEDAVAVARARREARESPELPRLGRLR